MATSIILWESLTAPAYCWYNNDEDTYGDPYGSLYNWQAVNSGELCPDGWHVPSDAEWNTLVEYLGGENVAGGKMKEKDFEHWNGPNTGATNESGFTALPGGYRGANGVYYGMNTHCFMWSSTEINSPVIAAWSHSIENTSESIQRRNTLQKGGLSVRCIKD